MTDRHHVTQSQSIAPALGALIPGAKKIAILRANRIGDLVFALPAIAALRAAYPGAEVVLLCSAWHADFLEGRDIIDRVIVIPASPGIRDDAPPSAPAELDAFFERMRAEQFDIAIQMHGGGRNSNPFVSRLGARLTVGFQDDDAPPLDRNVPYIYYQNEYSRYLELVSVIGAAPVTFSAELPVLSADLSEAARATAALDRPFALLNANATDERRIWPVERFARAGDWLASQGLDVVIAGGPGEEARAASVQAAMHAPALNLAGRLSLSGMVGVLASAALVISNDSGPLHVATAVGTPCVGIYWCGNVINGSPPGRLIQRVEMSWQTHCPHCGTNVAVFKKRLPTDTGCTHDTCFVDDVSVEQVLKTAGELLQQYPPASRLRAPAASPAR